MISHNVLITGTLLDAMVLNCLLLRAFPETDMKTFCATWEAPVIVSHRSTSTKNLLRERYCNLINSDV